MEQKIAPILIVCNLSSGGYSATVMTDAEQKDDNVGLNQDTMYNIDNGDTDVLMVSVVNGALQVRRCLVENDEDKTTDDESFLKVSDWELV